MKMLPQIGARLGIRRQPDILAVVDTIAKILSVAVGGAAGSVARHLVNISPLSRLFENFPFPTFFINVSGSFMIGFFLILLTDKFQVSENLRMMVIVGFLGAFTTFSTFEAEIYGLLRDESRMQAFIYLAASVVVGFVGLVAGVSLARSFPDR